MSHKIPKPARDILLGEYSETGASISSLASKHGVSTPVYRSWLIADEIPLKTHRQASSEANGRSRMSYPGDDRLRHLYVDMGMSIKELQRILNVGQETIYLWLDRARIELRSLGEAIGDQKRRRFDELLRIPEEDLRSAYSETKNKGILAKKFGVSGTTIKRLFFEYGIDTDQSFRSRAELDLFDFCRSIRPNLDWRMGDRSIANPFELDIVSDGARLAIEYGGLYWHSELTGGRSKPYHLKKLEMCLSKGYDLITIFESDPMDKIHRHLRSRLGLNERIGARECDVVKPYPPVVRDFHEASHLHGYVGSSLSYGLEHEGRLVHVISFGRSRYSSRYDWECTRMSSAPGITVVGGASRLFQTFRREHPGESIVTYADRRFGEGKTYLSCGFKSDGPTSPNYWYFRRGDGSRLWHRQTFQKHKIEGIVGFDPELTEWQNMINLGYDRIWDCGSNAYTYPPNMEVSDDR